MSETITTTDTIAALLRQAREAHEAISHGDDRALARALDAGDALIAAKAKVAHGEWQPALKSTGIPQSTARLYMQLARERARIEAAGCTSIRQARILLAGTKPKAARRRPAGDREGWTKTRVSDRYEEGYADGYRAGRADGIATATRPARNGDAPLPLDRKDLRWLIKQAHPDHHDDDLKATRVTQWLTELLESAR